MPPRHRSQSRRFKADWPAWRYGPDGQYAIFAQPEDVPDGWTKTPQQQLEVPECKPEICKESTIEQLQAANVEVDPRWGKAKLWEELEKVLNK